MKILKKRALKARRRRDQLSRGAASDQGKGSFYSGAAKAIE